MNAVLDMAQWYARQGVYVNAVQPNGKELVKSGPVRDMATRDKNEIEELFAAHPDRNLGVVTGPDSDLLVLDPDVKKGNKGLLALERMQKLCGTALPRTLHERTPSKGEHLSYHLDGADVPSGKLLIDGIHGLEVFGRPHNVVVSPSVIDGQPYELIGGRREIVPLPQVFIDFIKAHYVTKGEIGQPKTERNNGMYREACRLRRYNVPEAEAWSKLLALNSNLCKPPLDERELSKLFKSAWNQAPGYFATDLGNCERFRDQHGQDLRFVYESKRWLRWNGTRFVEDDARHTEQLMADVLRQMHLDAVGMPQNDETQRAARKAALQWSNTSERKERIQGALSLVPNPSNIIKQTALDADPWLFSTPNAIVDLRTGKPTRADQSQLITKVARMNYEPGEGCPLFLKTIERSLPDAEARAFFQRFAGYSLTGLTTEQCLLLVFGETETGKTTTLQTLEWAWGDYAKKTPATTWLNKGIDAIPNDVAALAGARLVISTESEQTARWATSMLKAATGQESLSARFMRGEWFTFTPQFKIAFGTNHLPSYDGGDRAMTRRLRLLEFKVKVSAEQRDGDLQEKLRAELPGILNWAIDGCLSWQRHKLHEPVTVVNAAKQYAADNDEIASFITDCCETGANLSVPSSRLHAAYVDWCRDHRVAPAKPSAFKAALTQRGYRHERQEQARVYVGLRLDTQEEPPHEY